MFAYDDADLILKVEESLRHVAPEKKPHLRYHMTTIVEIGLMMRKFEKASSNSYKKSLHYVFDKEQAMEQLRRELVDPQTSVSSRLLNQVYFIRKFDLDWQQWTNIDHDFLQLAMDSLKSTHNEADDDFKKAYLYSVALKYLCRNSVTTNLMNVLDPHEVIHILTTLTDNVIKTELVWTLSYVLESTTVSPSPDKEKFVTNVVDDVNTLLLNYSDIDDEAKAFLLNQLGIMKSGHATASDERQRRNAQQKSKTSAVNRQREMNRRKQLVVTKTVHVMKSSMKSLQSDDVQLMILNLASALKNRSRKIAVNVARQMFETVSDGEGSDRSMFRSTWAESLNLYQLACSSSSTVKQDDKDNYLPSCLFGAAFIFGLDDRLSTRLLYEFFINRMVACTLQLISCRQVLKAAAIDALMKGVVDVDKLACQMVGGGRNNLVSPNLERLYRMLVPSKDKFYELITESIWLQREEIEKQDGPDLLKRFYDELKDKLMKVETKSTWYWGTYTVKERRKEINKAEVNCIIKKELERLRMDNVNALYNCVCRDEKVMTAGKMQVIREYLTTHNDTREDTDEENFQSKLHEIIGIVSESVSGFDYMELLAMYFKMLMSNASLQTSKLAVNFLIRETRDPKRCKDFITDEVLTQLVALLQKGSIDNEIKTGVTEVINNFLEQHSEGLSESQLATLILCIKSSMTEKSGEVIEGILVSVLLTAENRKCLPVSIVRQLFSLFDSQFGEFMLVILSRCESLILEGNELELISEKLSSENVVVKQENSMISIEKPGSATNTCLSVALLAAQLLLTTLKGSNEVMKVSEKTVKNLLAATESCRDKGVRPITAKCLHLVSTVTCHPSCMFSKDVLAALLGLVSNEAYLVSTYAHVVYVKELRTRAAMYSEPLAYDLMESLSSVFVTQDSMKIGEKDFLSEVNQCVLEIVACEARKGQVFEDKELFFIMDDILCGNRCAEHSLKVLEILEVYTSFRKGRIVTIPQTTVSALEHALSLIDLADRALICLQNVIMNNQRVSQRTLQRFVDNLQMSDNSRRRLRAFKLLEKARGNQDLSDEAFLKLELVKAAYGLSLNGPPMLAMKQDILVFLRMKSQKVGLHMPKDTMLVLEKHVNEEATIEIIFNVSKNGQIIQYNLLNCLMRRFNPTEFNAVTIRLVDIVENVASNNQSLSEKFLAKLEQVFDNSDEQLEMKVLSIFIQRAHKGEQLSRRVVERILEKIGCVKGKIVLFEQELLSSIGSIAIQSSEDDMNKYKGRMQQTLWEGMLSDNSNTQKICVNSWAALMTRTQIETAYLTKLVKTCTDRRQQTQYDQSTRKKLLSVLRENVNAQSGFTEILRSKLELAELAEVNDAVAILDGLQCQMEKMNGQIGLLDQNYTQLANILNTQVLDVSVKRRALTLLGSVDIRSVLCTELHESLALLYESTGLKDVKDSCVSLLQASADTKIASPRVRQILSAKSATDDADSYKQQFLRTSPLLGFLKEQLKLNQEQTVDLLDMMNVADCVRLKEIDEFDEFLDMLLSSGASQSCHRSFVHLVEQVLMIASDERFGRYIQVLARYNQLIKRGNFQNLKVVVEKLLALDSQNMNDDLLVASTECIFLSIPNLLQINPDLLFKCLEALEYNLQHEHTLVRILSYAGLALAADKFAIESSVFKKWCDEKLDKLSQLANVKFTEHERVDLLYVIVSLKRVDLDVFSKNRQVWYRELLVSNIFQELGPCADSEKLEFYSTWLQIEQKHELQSTVVLLYLSLNVAVFKSLKQVNEVLYVLQQSGRVPNFQEFNMYDATVLLERGLKRDWCRQLLNGRLENNDMYDQGYIEQLSRRMCDNFEADFIQKLLNSVVAIDNLKVFETLIEFCSSRRARSILNNFMRNDVRCSCISDLMGLFQIEDLCGNFAASSHDRSEVSVLYGLLHDMLMKNCWTFEQLNEMIQAMKQNHSARTVLKAVVEIFRTISYYELSTARYEECLEIVKSSPDGNLLKELNELVIKDKGFNQKETIKNSEVLLKELEDSSSDPMVKEYVRKELRQQLRLVKSTSLKSAYVGDLPICEWERKHISIWADRVVTSALASKTDKSKPASKTDKSKPASKTDKSKPASKTDKSEPASKTDLDIVEAVAVVRRANFWHTAFNLRDTQILASLISLCDQPISGCDKTSRGKLLQVATGEGKSTIVCIVAIVSALRGCAGDRQKQVDVITSSPVLAERDAVEKMGLFRMFHLQCSSNSDTVAYIQGAKDCYKAHIVYGEVSQFQFDKLRDNYSQLRTLSGRQCRVAIVDEVDAMLIDDSSKIARLSSNSAGMDHLQSIYVFLWHKLLDIQRRFIAFDSRMYLLNGKVEFEEGKTSMRYADEEGDIIKIPDLEEYVRIHMGNLSPLIGELIPGNITDFLEKKLNEYLDGLVEQKVIRVPANLEEFFGKQRTKWVANCVEALGYQENVQYVVHNGQIKPVDYISTGVVQSATNWSDGLHQFLQLKHNLKMNSETLTTNFLSNIGFISAYDKVFGLTGTLGSKKAREVLRSVYKVEMVNIPQVFQKRYIEFPIMVSPNESKWFQDICSAALSETSKDRGVLIICETISQANALTDCMMARYRQSAIKTYTMNNMNQERQIERVIPGDVVIATNLAGRGTDIQTSDIEKWGGLHVIVTFMPQNQRVQDQAFGRTARQGKLGTGQMILNMQQLGADYENIDPSRVMKRRDDVESEQLDVFRTDDLQLIQTKDELFGRFCKFLNEKIRSDLRHNEKKGLKTVKEPFTDVAPTTYETSVVSAIEEQWAMFLRKLDDKTLAVADATEKCELLLETIGQNYTNNTVIKNLYYYVVIGNDFIVNQSDAKSAKVHFLKVVDAESAVTMNEQYFYGAAHVGCAWSAIALEDTSTSGWKHRILDSFNRAIDILSNEMAVINSAQGLLLKASTDGGSGFGQSDLDSQFNVKTTILGSYLNSVQQCVRVVRKSLRLIDVKCIDVETGSRRLFVDIDREHNMDTAVSWNLSKGARYELTFNDLTVHQDSGDQDQAAKTIDAAYRKDGVMSWLKSATKTEHLRSSYRGFKLQLHQISLSRVRGLLCQDKEFEDEITAQSAIGILEKETTYCNAWHLMSSYGVDLTTVQPDGTTELKSNLQIREAISHIQSKSKDDQLRYKFTLKEANVTVINECFWSQEKLNKRQPQFQIAFDGLDVDAAMKFVKLFGSRGTSAQVKWVAKKVDLLRLFDDENDYILASTDKFSFNVCTEDRKQTEYRTVDRNALLNVVNALESDEKSLALSVDFATTCDPRDLLNIFPESLFNISFAGVHFDDLWKLLCDRKERDRMAASLSFQSLDRDMAKALVTGLRTEHLEFCVVFSDLSHPQATHVIRSAHLTQEAIRINKVRLLSELFAKRQIPYSELAEFAARGIEYLLEISEQRPVPWFSICAVVALGAVQMAVGGILIATGFGATVGMSLISEGVSDMLYACRAYYNRQFDWTDYAKQKAVSIVISVCSVGIGKLKDAGKGATSVLSGEASALAAEATKEAGEAVTTQFVTNAKRIGQEMLKTGQNLKSLAFKFTGVKLGEAVAREGLNTGMQYLTNLSMDLIKPYINDHIQQKVQSKFCNPELNCLLKKMYALDSLAGCKTLQDRINKIVADAVNPERSSVMQLWNSVGLPLVKGILGTSENYGSAISMGFRIVASLQGLHAIHVILDDVHKHVCTKLSQLDRDTLTLNLILEQRLKLEADKARAISEDLTSRKLDITAIVSVCDVSQSTKERRELELGINAYRKTNKEVGLFLSSFLAKLTNMQAAFEQCTNMIVKSVSDRITDQIVRVIDSQLVSPWSTLAVSGLTDALSKRIQHYCLVDKNQNTDAMNEEQERFDELSKDEAAGKQLSDDEKSFLKRFGTYRTFGQQINYNSQAYCLDYQKYSVKYHSEHTTESKETSKESRERADQIRRDKPASMAEIAILQKKLGNVKLKVTTDENYQPTPEEVAQGVKVVYIERGQKDENGVDQIGHAYIINEDGSRTDVPANTNDCFYMVYSKILESQGVKMSVEELRQMTADAVESNANFAVAIEAEKWIHERYPTEANSLLFAAGQITFNQDSQELELEDEDIDDLLTALNNPKEKRGGDYGQRFAELIKTRFGMTNNQYIIRNPDGSTETVTGKFTTRYSDGRVVKFGGEYTKTYPNGSVETFKGEVTTTYPDGRVDTVPQSHTMRQHSDGPEQPVAGQANLAETVHLHHILPVKEIRQMIGSVNDKAQLKQEITKYINQDRVKPLVKEVIGSRRLNTNDGQILNAAVMWHPNNVVPGPNPARRSDDPGDKIDTRVLDEQSPAFRTAVDEIQRTAATGDVQDAIDKYTTMPAAERVDFDRVPAGNPRKPDKFHVHH